MSQSPMGDESHEFDALYGEIMGGADKSGAFRIETEEGEPDIVLEASRIDKSTRNKLQRAMPSGLFDAVELPDDIDDVDELDADDLDLSGVEMTSITFSDEGTDTWLDVIAEHFSHEYYSSTEIRSIFDRLPDEYMISAGSYLIELSDSTGPVTGFRRED